MEILIGTNIDGNIDGKREQNMTLIQATQSVQ